MPWHNLLFWYSLQHLVGSHQETEFSPVKDDRIDSPGNIQMSDPEFVMPMKAILRGVAVHYHDLWKIRAPLHNVEGFDMKPFDTLIMVINIFKQMVLIHYKL